MVDAFGFWILGFILRVLGFSVLGLRVCQVLWLRVSGF